MKHILLTLFLLLGGLQLALGQGWMQRLDDYHVTSFNRPQVMSTAADSLGYYVVGTIDSNAFSQDLEVRLINPAGQTVWSMTHPGAYVYDVPIDIVYLPSDESCLISYGFNLTNSGGAKRLLRVSKTGQMLYDVAINVTNDYALWDMHLMSDGHLVISGDSLHQDAWINSNTTGTGSYFSLVKLDLNGQPVWTKAFITNPNDSIEINYSRKVVESANGNYLIAGTAMQWGPTLYENNRLKVMNIDPAGNLLRFDLHLLDTIVPLEPRTGLFCFDLIATSDGGYVLSAAERLVSYDRALVLKADAQGNEDWRWYSSTTYQQLRTRAGAALENVDGTFTVTGNWPSASGDLALWKFSATGQLLWHQGIATGDVEPRGVRIHAGIAGGYAVLARDDSEYTLIGTDSLGNVFPHRVSGWLYEDGDLDCVYDSSETPLSQHIITANDGTNIYYTTTDANGHYSIALDSGTYSLVPAALSPYREFCPLSTNVILNSNYTRDTTNFGAQVTDSCVYLEVDISAAFLRRCFPSTYQVQYRNWGTIAEPNGYVEVTLDPYLTFVSSTRPVASVNGQVYRFDLDTIHPLAEGRFQIEVLVDCDSTALGQTHCTEAHIYPDTLCLLNYWEGAIIQASSTCVNDTVEFTLRNVGASMSAPLNYSVIEEHVMVRRALFQLAAGATETVRIPAQPGFFYRIEAEQEPGFPRQLGGARTSSNHVNCLALNVLNRPNILGQYDNTNPSSFVAVDCQENIGSFDPNDKSAQPLGYGPQHYIRNNGSINYRIRFQNTGTDTAFTVVIVDTLDAHLNPATLQLGASSHPYTWSLSGTNVLTVRFDNIMLPDSNVNEPLSHGFVKFQIDQDRDLLDGTVLTNEAGIYFDFNPPLITNEVFHTIGSNFVRFIGIDEPLLEEVAVRLYPNPFRESATLEVTGKTYDNLYVEVYSAAGQRVQTFQGTGNQLTIQRGQLPSGIYFYRLLGDHERLATGKLVVD